jgi:hypothetical protein
MRNMRILISAGILCCATLLVGCSVEPISSGATSTSLPTSSAPLPLANLLPTLATTPILATMPVSNTPTAHIFLPAEADILMFHDDFSSNQSGWTLDSGAQGVSTFADGQLVMTVRTPYASLESRLPASVPNDFYAEMTMRAVLCGVDNDAFGMAFRSQADEEYRVVLTCGGKMRFERQTGNTMTGANQWTSAAALLPGAPAENRIGIFARGMDFQFYVNGTVGFSFHDPVLQNGKLGVFIRTEKGQLFTVSFDDLSVYTLKAKSQ